MVFVDTRHAVDNVGGRTLPYRLKITGLQGDAMKQKTGSPPLYLASSAMGKMPAGSPEEQTQSMIATLEDCQVFLAGSANREAAQLLALAILQLRIKVNRVTDAELKALCDAMLVDAEPAKKADDRKALRRLNRVRRGSAALKLVK